MKLILTRVLLQAAASAQPSQSTSNSTCDQEQVNILLCNEYFVFILYLAITCIQRHQHSLQYVFRANRQTSSLTALDQSCRRRSDFALMTSQNSHDFYSRGERCLQAFFWVIYFIWKMPKHKTHSDTSVASGRSVCPTKPAYIKLDVWPRTGEHWTS